MAPHAIQSWRDLRYQYEQIEPQRRQMAAETGADISVAEQQRIAKQREYEDMLKADQRRRTMMMQAQRAQHRADTGEELSYDWLKQAGQGIKKGAQATGNWLRERAASTTSATEPEITESISTTASTIPEASTDTTTIETTPINIGGETRGIQGQNQRTLEEAHANATQALQPAMNEAAVSAHIDAQLPRGEVQELPASHLASNQLRARQDVEAVNVRSAPNDTAQILTQIRHNDSSPYTILEQSNGWYRIKVGTQEGWVRGHHPQTNAPILEISDIRAKNIIKPTPATIQDSILSDADMKFINLIKLKGRWS